jgi:hypothetical protein
MFRWRREGSEVGSREIFDKDTGEGFDKGIRERFPGEA